MTQEVEALAEKRKNVAIDGAKFADAWRGGYGPSMNRVRTGEVPWTRLDGLHRMILDKEFLIDFGVTGLSEADTDALNRAWHRLRPWPDAVAGLTRLKKRFHHRALVERQHLADDGYGETFRTAVGLHPRRRARASLQARPEVYRSAADFLDLKRDEVMMVAAHLGDLRAAKNEGLRTAFVTQAARVQDRTASRI